MFAGKDFPSLFEKDNFVQRRTIGNLFDPESLISGKEIARGMAYTNSKRLWANESAYIAAAEGTVSIEEILRYAPRVFVCARYARSDERVK